ncbi:hypothetical protein VK792_16650 [Mesobacterium sp. TK19101]|uniref:Response regulatory domain-containing protein n=1 Tax=Mesobacterium hydrothermale TaxID=3111907 RepID=A0ABU6HM28_9RHOB|nr:hypothetical protein [Mesobacterium sp. TK19101]MEC3862926.1 hypothetical protein [Mesobacterium sp. TK19101]
MSTLIVESSRALGALWKAHLETLGAKVVLTSSQTSAIEALRQRSFRVIVLDLFIGDRSALAIADYAGYRQPEAKVLFVTNTSIFSDGSLLRLYPNACALVRTTTPPEDLAAMVEHFSVAA